RRTIWRPRRAASASRFVSVPRTITRARALVCFATCDTRSAERCARRGSFAPCRPRAELASRIVTTTIRARSLEIGPESSLMMRHQRKHGDSGGQSWQDIGHKAEVGQIDVPNSFCLYQIDVVQSVMLRRLLPRRCAEKWNTPRRDSMVNLLRMCELARRAPFR